MKNTSCTMKVFANCHLKRKSSTMLKENGPPKMRKNCVYLQNQKLRHKDKNNAKLKI